ncbi:MAG: hypothetical protein AAF800_09160 [Planctomycetota bacterium]
MRCNIDAKGKSVRLIGGLGCLAAAVVVAALTLSGVLPVLAGVCLGLGLLAGGGFMVFEARAGWCVVRAMGFKTPI